MVSKFTDVPEELVGTFDGMTTCLENVKSAIKPMTETTRNEAITQLSPLDVAKVDLVSAYTCNSLFWVYLVTQGVNPKNHPIKQELERIQKYMNRVKEIEDRKNKNFPQIKVGAAKRLIRNATYDLEAKNKENATKRENAKRERKEDNSRENKHRENKKRRRDPKSRQKKGR